MIHLFKVEAAPKSTTRKAPLLPRFGFVVDIAGKRVSFRQVPITETILNLLERGPSLKNLKKIAQEQIYEVTFPFRKKGQTVNVKARTVARKTSKN
jgi:hypothetical protein